VNIAKCKIFSDLNSMSSLAVAIKISILLLLGIGYYRVILLVLLYLIIKTLVHNSDAKLLLNIICAPIALILLVNDYKNGQLLVIHQWEKIYHPIILFIALDYAASDHINRLIELISNGRIFSCCKSCGYANVKLTNKCRNCGFDGSSDEIYKRCFGDVEIAYRESYPLLSHKLNKKQIDYLSLNSNEIICACLKVNSINGIYVDDVKRLCSYVVVTNKNIIFISFTTFYRGWLYREKISVDLVNDISATTRKIGITDRKVVKVNADNHAYEFFLWLFDKSNDEQITYANMIRDIIFNKFNNIN